MTRKPLLNSAPGLDHSPPHSTRHRLRSGTRRPYKGLLGWPSATRTAGSACSISLRPKILAADFGDGAQAQEESLARSSGLYPSLLQGQPYYHYHRSHRNLLYSDHMIYSPRCPVFRSDDGALLEQPYLVDFITSPAPNAGALRRNTPRLAVKLEAVLRERAAKVLALAIHQRCDMLVLGAWGCGVFRNDPAMVSEVFLELLGPDQPYTNRFRAVAVLGVGHVTGPEDLSRLLRQVCEQANDQQARRWKEIS